MPASKPRLSSGLSLAAHRNSAPNASTHKSICPAPRPRFPTSHRPAAPALLSHGEPRVWPCARALRLASLQQPGLHGEKRRWRGIGSTAELFLFWRRMNFEDEGEDRVPLLYSAGPSQEEFLASAGSSRREQLKIAARSGTDRGKRRSERSRRKRSRPSTSASAQRETDGNEGIELAVVAGTLTDAPDSHRDAAARASYSRGAYTLPSPALGKSSREARRGESGEKGASNFQRTPPRERFETSDSVSPTLLDEPDATSET